MLRITAAKTCEGTTVRKHLEIKRRSVFNRRLRLEQLEERTLLSAGAAGDNLLPPGLAANLNNIETSAAAAIATADAEQIAAVSDVTVDPLNDSSFYAYFQTQVSIPETPSTWVGFDINASLLPADAVISKIIIHHTVTHPRINDLQVKLYSDSGTEWLIRQNSGGWNVDFDEYRTDTTVFAGVAVNQILHYRVRDTVPNGMVGTLQFMEMWIIYHVPDPPPDLTVLSYHGGNFVRGQTGAFYMISVTNMGTGPTSAPVSVHDILPAGLTATAMSGPGWTVNLGALTASRSDVLAPGASYAPIRVTVNVAGDAPASVTNAAQVSGGGDSNTDNNSDNDPTNILPALSNTHIVGTNLSVSNARDGQTLTVGYQINNDLTDAIALQLNCTLLGPGGELVADAARAETVNVIPGLAWYTREFTVDLPPQALTGAYDVTWYIHNDPMGDDAVTQAGALTINPPVPLAMPALMYHNVAELVDDFYTVSAEEFEAQMRALKAYGYTAVTLQDVLDYRASVKTPPAKPILITFDDAYQSMLLLVLPIISDPAINYKVTGFVNTANMRDESDPGGWYTDPLSWSEIQTLNESGFVDIKSHTVTHPHLTALDPSAFMAELVDSKSLIEQHLGPDKHVNFIAYPYGDYNLAVEQAAWQAGYTAAMNVYGELELTCDDKYALDRLQMDWHTSVEYDPADPDEFFFNMLQDPDVVAPNISISDIQYLDPVTLADLDLGDIHPGQSVLVRVNASNSGPDAVVTASLAIDSDDDHANGLIYDSHANPGQDIQVLFHQGDQSFQWTWTVPGDVPEGLYYSKVVFSDEHYVLGFKNSGWQEAMYVEPIIGTNGDDDIRLIRNQTDAGQVDVYVNNSGPSPNCSLKISALTQLAVLGGNGDDRLTLDFSNGNFLPVGGLFFDGGSHVAGDSLIVKNTQGNINITLSGTQMTLAGMQPVSYDNNEFFGFDLGGINNNLFIENATLRIKSDNAISPGTNVTVQDGILDLNGKTDTIGNLILISGSVLNGSLHCASYQIHSGTVAAAIDGPGDLIKSTTGQAAVGEVAAPNVAVIAGQLDAGSINTGTLTMVAGAKVVIAPKPPDMFGLTSGAAAKNSLATDSLLQISSETPAENPPPQNLNIITLAEMTAPSISTDSPIIAQNPKPPLLDYWLFFSEPIRSKTIPVPFSNPIVERYMQSVFQDYQEHHDKQLDLYLFHYNHSSQRQKLYQKALDKVLAADQVI